MKKEYDLDNFGPNGPAVGWGKIFVIKGRYDIVALDIENGNEIWSTRLSDIESTGIDIQLIAYNNMVYASTVPGSSNADFYTGGGIGIIYALDQQTGDIKWEFNTIDSEDIWGNPQVNSGGGAWYPPAIDIETGIMYWGTGNPAPWPGTEEFLTLPAAPATTFILIVYWHWTPLPGSLNGTTRFYRMICSTLTFK